jgi:hypothetical protein
MALHTRYVLANFGHVYGSLDLPSLIYVQIRDIVIVNGSQNGNKRATQKESI